MDQGKQVCSYIIVVCFLNSFVTIVDDDWGDVFEKNETEALPGGWGSSAAAPVVQPKPSKAAPKPAVLATRSTSSQSPVPSRGVSPAPLTPAASTAGMSKEEKAAEMARRKEERKQVSAL